MKKILYGSLILSILWTILFWNNNLGISVILFTIPGLLILLKSLKENGKIENKKGIYWCIPIIMLSLTYFIFNNTLFQMLNLPIIVALTIIMCMDITEGKITENKFIRRIISKIFKPFTKFKEVFEIMKLKEKIEEQKKTQNEKITFIKKLVKALIIAIPIILIVILLLSSADSVFGNIFNNIPYYLKKNTKRCNNN